MKTDNIYIKMPDRMEYFLAATAVVQDYFVQLHKQVMMRQRHQNFNFTIEIPDDEFLFFWPMFPNMDYVMRGEVPLNRADWSCLLDLSDIDLVKRIASVPKKHIVEAWGIMVGASPRLVPELGPLLFNRAIPTVDVLMDERVPVKDTMLEYMRLNFPHARVVVKSVVGMRPSTLFSLLSDTKFYVGVRDGATYLSSAMRKPTLEFYGSDLPASLLGKPHSDTYKMFYGTTFDPGMVWAIFEEMYCQAAGEPEDFMPDNLQFAGGVR